MRRQTKNILLQAVGWFFVALGTIGVVLPVLPTTPFLLIALWAFSQSSERFHYWLMNHRYFGPSLQAWEKHGIIPMRAKILALSTMTVSATLIILLTQTPWYAVAAMLGFMGIGALFITTRPSTVSSGE